MKRKRPPDITEPRRKRALSEEERDLWGEFARDIKPLRPRPKVETKPKPSGAALEPLKKKSPPMREVIAPIVAPNDVIPVVPALASLGRRERAQIARGRKDIEARLDLHGKTQVQAHRVLLNFLNRASEDGLSLVLVITGKGKIGSDSERGVLRRQVPEWLGLPEFRRLVIGFETAHIGHGGEGALYVRVRRGR